MDKSVDMTLGFSVCMCVFKCGSGFGWLAWLFRGCVALKWALVMWAEALRT